MSSEWGVGQLQDLSPPGCPDTCRYLQEAEGEDQALKGFK